MDKIETVKIVTCHPLNLVHFKDIALKTNVAHKMKSLYYGQ